MEIVLLEQALWADGTEGFIAKGNQSHGLDARSRLQVRQNRGSFRRQTESQRCNRNRHPSEGKPTGELPHPLFETGTGFILAIVLIRGFGVLATDTCGWVERDAPVPPFSFQRPASRKHFGFFEETTR